jgi:hypothetical protein
MKKLLASLTLAAALALLPAQTASADILDLSAGVFPDDEFAALSSTGDPFAVGGGITATGTHFAFSGHCKDASGLCNPAFGPPAPSGYAVVSDPVLGQAQGHVCSAVVFPPFGILNMVVEKGSGVLGSSPNFSLVVTDGGQPPSGADDINVGAPPNCVSAAIGVTQVVTQGNIVVK